MGLIQIVSWMTGNVLFELEREDNSIRVTLEAGVKAGANLRGAKLRGTDLRGADLYGADLRDADLRGTDLYVTNLRGTNLRGADLGDADLCDADLRGADLCDADLRGAKLWDADLRGTDLRGANLRGADLYGAKNAALAFAQISIVPELGAFEGFKKCRDGALVRIRIPAEARRSSATGRKCRAEFVDVLEIIPGSDFPNDTEAVSMYSADVVYRVGERVTCDHWEEDRFVECGGGIHFFLSRIEAEAYN